LKRLEHLCNGYYTVDFHASSIPLGDSARIRTTSVYA
jgi:hypothetical protein